MAVSQKRQKNVVPMLLKTFDLLDAFVERPAGLTYMDLIERYPYISKVSIYRILCSLETLGYLRKDEDTSRYELGAKFIELGRVTERRQDVVRIARPYLQKVLEKFKENVNLAKVEAGELIYLCTLQGDHPLRVTEMPNRRHAVYCSGLGKAILSRLPEEEREDTLQRLSLVRLTPHTITSKRTLREDLKRTSERGFAVDNEENLLGVRCVAAPILDDRGYPIAAISITGPISRITPERTQKMGNFLALTVSDLSEEQFGYRPRDVDHTQKRKRAG